MTEHLDLLVNIVQEDVALSSADEHAGENWNIVKVHGHDGVTTDGVHSYFTANTQYPIPTILQFAPSFC